MCLCTVIHSKMLASRKLTPKLNTVLNDVIGLLIHFEQLCEEMDAVHKHLPLHTEVTWLSKVRSLECLNYESCCRDFPTDSTCQVQRLGRKTCLLV